jgi:NTP pyrophosphatase (non-canonical NTP hydrolase)
MDSFNDLSHADAELFALLAEECGETVQAIGKILRHGKHSWNPEVVGKRTNIEDLEKELGDILAVVELMRRAKVIDADNMGQMRDTKLEKVWKYLHYNSRLRSAPPQASGPDKEK